MGNLKKIGIGSAQKIAGSMNQSSYGGALKISNERSRWRLSSGLSAHPHDVHTTADNIFGELREFDGQELYKGEQFILQCNIVCS